MEGKDRLNQLLYRLLGVEPDGLLRRRGIRDELLDYEFVLSGLADQEFSQLTGATH